MHMTTPVVVNAAFSAAALAAPRAGINDPSIDEVFLHTFQWDPAACCEITAATLTVVMRANQAGSSQTSSDSGNDTISVSIAGATVPGLGGTIYSGAVVLNQQTTRTIVMNAAALALMNQHGMAGFIVQDDTAVLSADLRIERCCVNVRTEPTPYR